MIVVVVRILDRDMNMYAKQEVDFPLDVFFSAY